MQINFLIVTLFSNVIFTNSFFPLNDIIKTNEKVLIIPNQYKSNTFIGISSSNIYQFEPFQIINQITFPNNKISIIDSSNIIFIDKELICLVCLKKYLLLIYNISNGDLKDSLEYPDESFIISTQYKCEITNNSEEIYILFPHQNLEKLSLIRIRLYNNLSINGNIINIPTNFSSFIELNPTSNNILLFPNKISHYLGYINMSDSSNVIQTFNLNNNFLIGGFEMESDYILYGYNNDSADVISVIIYTFNKTHLEELETISSSKIIKDTISGFKSERGFYISFYDTLNFYLYYYESKEKKYSIKTKFYYTSEIKDINYIRGYLLDNDTIGFIIKDEINSINCFKMTTYRYTNCTNYEKIISKEGESIAIRNITQYISNENNIVNKICLVDEKDVEVSFSMSGLYNENTGNINNTPYINIKLNESNPTYSTKYVSYVTNIKKWEDDDDYNLTMCDFKIKTSSCDTTCDTCKNVSNEIRCLTCKTNYYLIENITYKCALSTENISNHYFSLLDQMHKLCNSNCKSCKYNSTYCTKCGENLYLTKENTCIQKCKRNTLYYIENNKVICLENKTSCPQDKPFFNEETLECFKQCDLQKRKECRICDNDSYQEYNKCIPKDSQVNILDYINDPLNNGKTINGDTTITIEKYPSDEFNEGSTINLKECEGILREKYNIPNNESLIIKKKDTYIEGKASKDVDFNVYDSNGRYLDLKVCDGIPISIAVPLGDVSNINLEQAKQFNELGVDIYNPNDDFFINICSNNDLGLSTDISVQDRKDFYVDANFCDENCVYKGINYDTNTVECDCNSYNSSTFNTSNEDVVKKINFFKKIVENINYKIVICYKLLNHFENYKKNFGFYFVFIIFILLIILAALHFSFSMAILHNKISKLMNLPKEHKTIIHQGITLKANPTQKSNNKKGNLNLSNSERDLNLEKHIFFDSHLKDQIIYPMKKNEEKDYNDMTYFTAIEEDKRNFFIILYQMFLSKIFILEVFYYKREFDVIYVSLSTFLFFIMIDFSLNALLFNDDIISQKYHNNNKLDFWTSESLSIIANVIGNCFTYYISKLSNYSFAIELIQKEIKVNAEIIKTFEVLVKRIKIRLMFYFIIQFLFMVFFLYYLTIFCALYQYSQKALFINYLLGLVNSLIYTAFIALIISLIRCISLKCLKRRVYKISQFFYEHF